MVFCYGSPSWLIQGLDNESNCVTHESNNYTEGDIKKGTNLKNLGKQFWLDAIWLKTKGNLHSLL